MRQRRGPHANRLVAAAIFCLAPLLLVVAGWSLATTSMVDPNTPYPAVGANATAIMALAATLAALPGFAISLSIVGPVWFRSARRLQFDFWALSGLLGVVSGPFSVMLVFATDAEFEVALFYPSMTALLLATPLFLVLRRAGAIRSPPPSTSCSCCGYDVSRTSGGPCPECGSA